MGIEGAILNRVVESGGCSLSDNLIGDGTAKGLPLPEDSVCWLNSHGEQLVKRGIAALSLLSLACVVSGSASMDMPKQGKEVQEGATSAGAVLASDEQPKVKLGEALPGPGVLLYTDLSPGAYPFWIGYGEVAERRGRNATLVTDPVEFARLLPSEDWTEVDIIARHTPDEPFYAKALREYVDGQPGRFVQMLLWHDNGTEPPADAQLVSSLAIVLWSHARSWDVKTTTIKYSNVRSDNPDATKPHTVTGYHFPDFADLKLMDPRVASRIPETTFVRLGGWLPGGGLMLPGGGSVVPATGPPSDNDDPPLVEGCKNDCREQWLTGMQGCDDNRNLDAQQCEELYGGSGGDPEEYTACMKIVNNDHSACLEGALHRYERCKDICMKDVEEEAEGGVEGEDEESEE